MKVTYNWLTEFVEIKIAPEALAEQLTAIGLEVTGLEKVFADTVFEIEVTSNRPDWLSVVGIAREVAAITNLKIKNQKSKPQSKIQKSKPGQNPLDIKIEDKKDCPLYTAKIIRGVKVGPSPDWLRKRLEMIGCRSINNIVDITNYILFTYGEPLHAFDLERLVLPSVIVRRAKAQEKIVTIDNEEKILDPGVLVIADRNKAIAIAGIMGGKSTEVSMATQDLLLEAALFDPALIRKARRKLGLQTDSSYRFERGIDPETAVTASWAAVEMIQSVAGGSLVYAKSSGAAKKKNRCVMLEPAYCNKILGEDIAPLKMRKILNCLGFKVKAGKKNLSVQVPGYRQDVVAGIDLVEEVARIYGYDSIPLSLPKVITQVSLNEFRGLTALAKQILFGQGLNEVITYSLVDRESLRGFDLLQDKEAVEIANPLSKEQEILRTTLIPSLAACVAYNLNQKEGEIKIFEIAKVFCLRQGSVREELSLGIALSSERSLQEGLLHLKGILEVLLARLGLEDYDLCAGDNPESVGIKVNQEPAGLMMQLSGEAKEEMGVKNKKVFAMEISLEKIFSLAKLEKRFRPLPKYPGITRDISLVLKEEIAIKEVLAALKEKAGSLLNEIKVKDYYQGSQIPVGFRGMTISCLYRSEEKTLTEAEINPLHNLLCSILQDNFSAKIR